MKNCDRPLIVTMIIALFAYGSEPCAGSQRLACALRDTEAKSRSENRPIVVDFDEEAKTLSAENDGHIYKFEKVSISNVTMNGQAEDVSLGIDRSSLGIVWQQYGADDIHTEFGACQRVKPGG